MITPEDREPWWPLIWFDESFMSQLGRAAYPTAHPIVVRVAIRPVGTWFYTYADRLPASELKRMLSDQVTLTRDMNVNPGRNRQFIPIFLSRDADLLSTRAILLSMADPFFTPEYIDAETRIVIRSTGPG